MKLRNRRLIRVVGILAAGLIRLWMSTVRIRTDCRDEENHPADADAARYIYAFWHESLLSPVRFRKGMRIRVLISQHADGELGARLCAHLGIGVVRGSTTRGGSAALVELWDCSQRSHVVFTPDGPRGPRRRVQAGMIALASRSGLPIVPVGVGFSRAWRARSWDRFAVPWPFSRCAFVAEKAIHVPPGIDREELERLCRLVEERMLSATAAAQQVAGETTALDKAIERGPHTKGVPRSRAAKRSSRPSS
jgi:lysophospholipid acyltransferase (LPLAT)-like uncharacterized protein